MDTPEEGDNKPNEYDKIPELYYLTHWRRSLFDVKSKDVVTVNHDYLHDFADFNLHPINLRNLKAL